MRRHDPIPSRSSRPVAALLLALGLGACAAGPEPATSAVHVADAFTHAPESGQPAPARELEFWRAFGDPLLGTLVEDALSANHDLRAALARRDRADALLRERRHDRAPTVTARGEAGSARTSASQLPGAPREARDTDRYELGVGAHWELDVVGRVRRQVEADRLDARAAAADLAALQILIVSELTTAYFELRGVQTRLRVAHANARNQHESLRLIETRLHAGQGTALEAERARAQLASTRAAVPALQAAAAALMHRIAVLSGRPPDSLATQLNDPAPVPSLADGVNPGAPGELLRRRPDVAAAEQRLHAATARIGVATADLFPRFTLNALFGTQAASTGALFGRDSESRLLVLGVDWSFLDAGRVRARIAAAEAGADEHLALYERTVLLALEETETALAGYRHARQERDYRDEAAAAAARATAVARLQFDGGLIDHLALLDAERAQFDAEDALARSEAASAVRLVAVYRALAGGWPQRLPSSHSGQEQT